MKNKFKGRKDLKKGKRKLSSGRKQETRTCTGFCIAGIIFLLAAAGLFCYLYDGDILAFLKIFQNPVFDLFFFTFTALMTVYIGVPVILILAFWSEKNRRLFYDLLVAVAIDAAAVMALKAVIARPRPYSSMLFDAEFYSFPSGHASRAFAVFGILNKHIKNLTCFFYGLASLVALSRLYFGVHYPTDVFVGALMGWLISKTVVKFGLGDKLKHVIFRLKKKYGTTP